MAKFGYVKIVSGQAARRIGRFIGWDEKGVKAKVAFGYDTDILPYTNYHFFSVNSITNNITKQDLVDRYFELSQALKAIDLRAHPKIKKYTAEHTSIITECNLVRHLLQVFFDLKNLTLKNKEKNITLLTNTSNIMWINEFALELEIRGFQVGILNHKIIKDNFNDELKYALEVCDHYIFIEEYNHQELKYIKENLSSVYQSLTVVVETAVDEDYENGYLYFDEPFTDRFEQSLQRLVERLESPETYSQI